MVMAKNCNLDYSKADIIYLLIWHLNRYKWMSVPEVAVFHAQETEAYIDHKNQVIYPPVLKARLIESGIFQTDEMLNHMVAYTGYDKNDLNRQLLQLAKNLLAELEANSEAYFMPFGRLSRSGGRLSFESNGKNLHEQYFGMKEQPLTALERKADPTTVGDQPAVTASAKDNKKWYSEFKYLFWILLALWVVFLSLLFCPAKCRKPQPGANQPVSQIDDDSLRREDSLLRAIIDQKSSGEGIDSQAGEPSLLDDSTGRAFGDNQLPNEEKILPENVTELDKIVRNKTCVIIIGSFVKKSNADRLAKRVRADGYRLYRAPYKEYTRIGIRFDCMARNLQDVLSELKARYDPQAWILKY